ncbi:MAG: rhomboid family intramembrane serine protease [Verrucomicrobiales bacterium]|nr:rhomboid family intramembrane serine protease [Verrucomicrobiales bacterium]
MSLTDRDFMRPGGHSWQMPQWTTFHSLFWLIVVVAILQHGLGWGMMTIISSEGTTRLPIGGVSLETLSEGRIWTMFTFMFVHRDLLHLAFNLVVFWFVGRRVQEIFGGGHLVRLFLIGGLLGAALRIGVYAWLVPAGSQASGQPVLMGASASVFALFFALAVSLPRDEVGHMIYLILPIRVSMLRAGQFVIVLEMVLFLLDLFSSPPLASDAAHVAHLGGALAGWYYIRMLGYGEHPLTYRRLWQREEDAPLRRQRRNARLVTQNAARRRPHVELDLEAVAEQIPSEAPPVELDVDEILEKIHAHGIDSLTVRERRTLENASQKAKRGSSERS